MSIEIRLSQIGGRVEDFRVAVEEHITKLTAFNKEVGKPRPTAPALIEAAVKRVQIPNKPDSYETDYTLVDDTPPPPPALTLEDKKNQWHAKLAAAENTEKYLVMPPRKRRLSEMQYQAAVAKKEEDRTQEENDTIASFLDVNKKWTAVSMKAAQAESDIEDLTEDNVDSWQLPIFG